MAKYRKKPVVIEAFQWTGGRDQIDDPVWMLDAFRDGTAWINQNGVLDITMSIETLEGVVIVRTGDYIIKGVKGELYPCKPDIFEMTYEKVED